MIDAQKHVNPNDTVLSAAQRIASLAVAELQRSDALVEVSLRGLRGLSSSFFNEIYRTILRDVGRRDLELRIRFIHDSSVQAATDARSRDSVLRSTV